MVSTSPNPLLFCQNQERRHGFSFFELISLIFNFSINPFCFPKIGNFSIFGDLYFLFQKFYPEFFFSTSLSFFIYQITYLSLQKNSDSKTLSISSQMVFLFRLLQMQCLGQYGVVSIQHLERSLQVFIQEGSMRTQVNEIF